MNHPPPLLPSEELENLQQQQNQHRKPNQWNNNSSNNSSDMEEMEERNDLWSGPSLLGLSSTPPFMGNRPPFQNNFRGRGNRGNSPYVLRGRGRGAPRGFRGNGNFRGRGGSW